MSFDAIICSITLHNMHIKETCQGPLAQEASALTTRLPRFIPVIPAFITTPFEIAGPQSQARLSTVLPFPVKETRKVAEIRTSQEDLKILKV